MAGKFSNSELAHAVNFEAPFFGGAATYDGETADFYKTHRSLTPLCGVGLTSTTESV